MEATFLNGERSEYTEPTQEGAHSAVRRCRVVHASWHPDQLGLSVLWIREFCERIDGLADRNDVVIEARANDEPGEAGTTAAAREAIRLGDVTDFVAVMTYSYLNAQRKNPASELAWILQTVTAKAQPCTIWLAVLEGKFDLTGRRLANINLGALTLWHGTRGERLMEPYTFYKSDDPATKAAFATQLNEAVDRLKMHGLDCEICRRPA